MVNVKSGDLAREYRDIKDEIDQAVARILSRGWFILGPEVEAFERAFAQYLGVNYCVGVASGTDAIALALLACEVGPGDEVITVSHTAVPTVSAISMVGARPRFVDICPDTYLLDVRQVETAITPRTRGIVPVHLYGQCVDMDPLLELAGGYSIPIIEDCAQAHGATYKGQKVGTMGLMGAFSFYPSKNLGCYGDGGAVVTNDAELYDKLKMLRNYGQRERYYHEIKGINSRLDELQAAILGVKLRHLDTWIKRRRLIAQMYNTRLHDLPITTPVEAPNCLHVYHLYVVQSAQRDRLQNLLGEQGVETLIHYPMPVHRQAAYADLGYADGTLPITEATAQRVLSLPIYPQMTEDEIATVINAIGGVLVYWP